MRTVENVKLGPGAAVVLAFLIAGCGAAERAQCGQDSECIDGDLCTEDRCINDACSFVPVTGCCASDSDCETGESCQENTCVPEAQPDGCRTDDDCPLGQRCAPDSGECVPPGECSCDAGMVCLPDHRCVPDCRIAIGSCPPHLPGCDPATGLCMPGDVTCRVPSQEFRVTNPGSGNLVWAKAFVPQDASSQNLYPAVVTVAGGSGAGSEMESVADPSRNPCGQAERGFVVVVFDADGRGNTPGEEDYCGHIHQDGLAAVVEHVAGLPFVDPDRIGISTSSYGITMGSGVLARYPDLPVRFLVDFEGPGDRTDTGHCDASDTGHIEHDCDDEAWWAEREATTFLQDIQVPYLRIQNASDHVQPDNLHCIRMVNNATSAVHGGNGRSPWTRVNSAAMNPANQTYDETSPPAYYAQGEADEAVDFWDEMFRLDL